MSETPWADVDRYLIDLLIPADEALDYTVKASAAAGLPSIAVAPPFGRLLHILARVAGARRILEIGTLGGYSTIWLARAVGRGGLVTTLELDPKHAALAEANIAHAGLLESVDIRLGRAADTLASIHGEGGAPYDMIFIDADKASIPEYFTWSLKLARPGSLMVVDNVIREGAVIDGTSTDPNVIGVRRFNEMLAAESRVTATTIQTVGMKGYDGATFLIVN
ncbi:MAG: O-methyltransferase [Gemmatimonadota bacterium]|nr:O-methyltransferase [Gemmatimonadota bacterium]